MEYFNKYDISEKYISLYYVCRDYNIENEYYTLPIEDNVFSTFFGITVKYITKNFKTEKLNFYKAFRIQSRGIDYIIDYLNKLNKNNGISQ